MNRLARLRSALLTWPNARLWGRASAELIWLAPVLVLLAWVGGLTSVASGYDPLTLAKLTAIALVAPAFVEEVVFRVLLLPPPASRVSIWRCALSIALFVAWHPLQIFVFGLRWGDVVLNPAFLVAVAALGLALTRVYLATHSIWPSVIIHWLVVVAWKLAGGASPWS